jgi:hypothetical protein
LRKVLNEVKSTTEVPGIFILQGTSVSTHGFPLMLNLQSSENWGGDLCRVMATLEYFRFLPSTIAPGYFGTDMNQKLIADPVQGSTTGSSDMEEIGPAAVFPGSDGSVICQRSRTCGRRRFLGRHVGLVHLKNPHDRKHPRPSSSTY